MISTESTTSPWEVRKSISPRLHGALAGLVAGREKHDSASLRALAELRRAVDAPLGEAPEATAVLYGLIRIPPDATGELPAMTPGLAHVIQDALLVSSLVAFTRVSVRNVPSDVSWARRSFGRDLRLLRRDPQRLSGLQHAFKAVVNAPREDLSPHLRRAVSLLGAADGALDVAALLRDLGRWEYEDSDVQQRWAYHFWADVQKTDSDQDDMKVDA